MTPMHRVGVIFSYTRATPMRELISVITLLTVSLLNAQDVINVAAPNVDKTVKCGKLITVEWESPKEGDGEVVFKVKPLDVSYKLANPGILHIATPCRNVLITVECYRIDYENRKFETKDVNIQVIPDDYVEPKPDPRPNPSPNPGPDPKPEPAPDGTLMAKWAVWVEEQNDRDSNIPQTTTMLNRSVRDFLSQRQIQVRIFDKDETDAASYNNVEQIKNGSVPLPAFFLIGDSSKDFMLFPAPKNFEELKSIIERNTVR